MKIIPIFILLGLTACVTTLKPENGEVYLHCGTETGGPYTEKYKVKLKDNFKIIKKDIEGNKYCVSSWFRKLPKDNTKDYISKEVYLYKDVVITRN